MARKPCQLRQKDRKIRHRNSNRTSTDLARAYRRGTLYLHRRLVHQLASTGLLGSSQLRMRAVVQAPRTRNRLRVDQRAAKQTHFGRPLVWSTLVSRSGRIPQKLALRRLHLRALDPRQQYGVVGGETAQLRTTRSTWPVRRTKMARIRGKTQESKYSSLQGRQPGRCRARSVLHPRLLTEGRASSTMERGERQTIFMESRKGHQFLLWTPKVRHP